MGVRRCISSLWDVVLPLRRRADRFAVSFAAATLDGSHDGSPLMIPYAAPHRFPTIEVPHESGTMSRL